MSTENSNLTQRTPQLTTLEPKQNRTLTRGTSTITGRFYPIDELQNARGLENTEIEDMIQSSSASGFYSHDKIPRRWLPLFAFFIYLSLLVIIILYWNDLHKIYYQSLSSENTNQTVRTILPSKTFQDKASSIVLPVPSSQTEESNLSSDFFVEQPILDPEPDSSIIQPIESPVTGSIIREDDNTPVIKTYNKPLRGYSWSPSANSLVPIQ